MAGTGVTCRSKHSRFRIANTSRPSLCPSFWLSSVLRWIRWVEALGWPHALSLAAKKQSFVMVPSRMANETQSEAEKRKRLVALITLHQRRIYSYIYTLVPNRQDADDILQETSLVICEK